MKKKETPCLVGREKREERFFFHFFFVFSFIHPYTANHRSILCMSERNSNLTACLPQATAASNYDSPSAVVAGTIGPPLPPPFLLPFTTTTRRSQCSVVLTFLDRLSWFSYGSFRYVTAGRRRMNSALQIKILPTLSNILYFLFLYRLVHACMHACMHACIGRIGLWIVWLSAESGLQLRGLKKESFTTQVVKVSILILETKLDRHMLLFQARERKKGKRTKQRLAVT